MRVVAAVVCLALSACGPAAQQTPQGDGPAMPADQPARLELSCAAFADLTPATLAERYGPANITTETMSGPEGESYEATVLFANDPARRLEINWTRMNAAIDSVFVKSPNTIWVGPGGITVGALLPEVERANGRAFSLLGFGWDYGGWVSDWKGGALADDNNCRARVRFTAGGNPASNVIGDAEFSSDGAPMRAANPTVAEIGLMFIRPE